MSVKSNPNDSKGGHVDSHTGKTLDQSAMKALTHLLSSPDSDLHMMRLSSAMGQCSRRASMAVRGMVKAVSRSDKARFIMRIFLRRLNKISWIFFSRKIVHEPCTVEIASFCSSNYQIDIEKN